MEIASNAAALRRCIEGLDLTSADGRAGLRCLMREFEESARGIIGQVNAGLELKRLGISTAGDR